MQEIILKLKQFERGLSKSLKKVIHFFSQTQSFSVDKISKNKRGLELAVSHSGFETSSDKFLY